MRKIPMRQGDILLIPVSQRDMPKDLVEIDRDAGRVVLAYGEVTGHAHAIADDEATLFRQEDRDELADRFLRVSTEVALTHEEHDTIALPPGNYIVRHKREYQPSVAPRYVAD